MKRVSKSITEEGPSAGVALVAIYVWLSDGEPEIPQFSTKDRVLLG